MSAVMPALALCAMATALAWSRSYLVRRRARVRVQPPGPGLSPTPTPAPTFGRWPAVTGSGQAGRRTAERLVAVGAGAAVALAGLASMIGPMALGVAAIAGPAAVVARHRQRRTERRRLRRTQLPAALDRLATALRAGTSVPTALVEAGAAMAPPIGPELVALGREANAGRAVADVLDGWSARNDDAGTRLATTALILATAVGGAPGKAVDGVAATLRERVDLADERRALASQARLSAVVLAAAPVGFAVLLGSADGRAASFLLGTPAGWFCMGAGLALDAAGAWWMARLMRGTEP
jgi:tight adherence protein B